MRSMIRISVHQSMSYNRSSDLVLKVLVDKVVTSAKLMVMERFSIETKRRRGEKKGERGREGKRKRSNFYSKEREHT